MKYKKTSLTPAKKRFVDVFVKTDNATEAVRQAYPELASTSTESYLSTKAGRMMRNDDISTEIVNRRLIMAQNANKAANRIKQLIDSEKEEIALKASIFSYEQEEGKATQNIQSTTEVVTLNLSLADIIQQDS